VDVPSAILALVLAEVGVGGLALLWFAPTWGNVRHGYEILLGSTLGVMLWGAWATLDGPLQVIAADGGAMAGPAATAETAMLMTAGIATASVVALLAKQAQLGRILGIVAVLAGLYAFFPIADLRAARAGAGGLIQGYVELVLGAFFLGAVWDGMVLGHWYLVERKLSNRFMVWMSWANVVAIGAAALAVVLSARNPVPCAGLEGSELAICSLGFSPILSHGNFTLVLGFGVLALVAIIAGFNIKLAREGGRSIQAATGMFYLAVVLAPAVEFAAKVRYF